MSEKKVRAHTICSNLVSLEYDPSKRAGKTMKGRLASIEILLIYSMTRSRDSLLAVLAFIINTVPFIPTYSVSYEE